MDSAGLSPNFKPIYQVIKDEIVADIRSGRVKPHEPLDSRHTLIKKYNCSWATVHRAVSELILEGVLYAKQGKGTFVAPRPTGPIQVLSLHPIPSWHHSLVEMLEGLREGTFNSSVGLNVINLPHDVPPGYDLDGHVILTPAVDQAHLLQAAMEQGMRFVVLGSDYPGNDALPCVNADTKAGTKQAISRLIEVGHRHIGIVGVMDGFPNYQREIEGYKAALTEAGLIVNPDHIVYRPGSEDDFHRQCIAWLNRHPEVTALFTADYATSLTVFQIAREKNIDIPGEMSLICMDELPTADLLTVRPVRVVQPFQAMGRLAIQRLVGAMTEGSPLQGTSLLPCTIMEGDSVQPPRPTN